MTLNNMGALYRAQGRLPEAVAAYSQALAIFQETLSPEHPYLLLSAENYAGVLADMEMDE